MTKELAYHINQFATKREAQKYAKRQSVCWLKHRVVKDITWRNLKPVEIWTTQLTTNKRFF